MAYYNPNQEQPQIQVQYPAPIVYYAAPAMTYQSAVTRPYGPYYEKQTSIGLGATQIVLACLSISAGAMAIIYGAGYYYVGVGIWAGAFFLIAGALSIAAGKEPTNSLITATLVFSVFDIIFGVALLSVAAYGLTDDLNCKHHHHPDYCIDWLEEAVSANSLMIAFGALEFIFGIWMTVISAQAIDKGSRAQLAPVPVTFAPTHRPQTMIIQGHPPTTQHQPQPYYLQAQHPSASHQQPMMQIGVQQTPITNIKL